MCQKCTFELCGVGNQANDRSNHHVFVAMHVQWNSHHACWCSQPNCGFDSTLSTASLWQTAKYCMATKHHPCNDTSQIYALHLIFFHLNAWISSSLQDRHLDFLSLSLSVSRTCPPCLDCQTFALHVFKYPHVQPLKIKFLWLEFQPDCLRITLK